MNIKSDQINFQEDHFDLKVSVQNAASLRLCDDMYGQATKMPAMSGLNLMPEEERRQELEDGLGRVTWYSWIRC